MTSVFRREGSWFHDIFLIDYAVGVLDRVPIENSRYTRTKSFTFYQFIGVIRLAKKKWAYRSRSEGGKAYTALATGVYAHRHGLWNELEQLDELHATIVRYAQLTAEVRVVRGHEARELHA